MPNMIDNIVGIIGPYDRLAELCYGAERNKFLQTVRPLSPSGEKQATDTWGVKWEIQDPLTYLHSNVGGYGHDWCLQLKFESPWAPPIGAYQILEDEGLIIEAHFMDTSGLDYGGSYCHGEYKSYPLDRLPEDIINLFNETYDYERLTRFPDQPTKAA